MPERTDYDLIVGGASVAGCAVARLAAQAGLRVALMERSADPASYKKACTHFLQPCAAEVITRLGLNAALEEAGAQRNHLEVWTRWGWIREPRTSGSPGYNIRRQKLDPLMRAFAATTPGVDFMRGTPIVGLCHDGRRVSGVECVRDGARVRVSARLVIGADGHGSAIATLAGLPAYHRPNRRFTYFTYFRDLSLGPRVNSRYWYLGDNLAYAFMNDDGLTLLGVFLPRERLAEFREDVEGNFLRFWAAVPDGPLPHRDQRVCEMRGMLQLANTLRRASAPGIALVGDAALVLDPIWGTGCSFALLSASWLVDSVAEVLRHNGSPQALDRALVAYRWRHLRETLGHALHIANFSRVRDTNPIEELLFSAATRDAHMAAVVLSYLSRRAGLFTLLAPANLLRAVRANLRHRSFRPIDLDAFRGGVAPASGSGHE